MNLLVLPVLVPLLSAVVLMALDGRSWAARWVSLGSALGTFLAAVVLLVHTAGGEIATLSLGHWGAGLGIVWVVDGLSAILLTLSGLVFLATVIYAPGGLRDEGESRHFWALLQFLAVGVNGSFLTADFFNLFVFFEIMLLTSFVLMCLGGRDRQLERAFPYVAVNLVGSLIFLAGVGALYGVAGTVNMAELSHRLAAGTVGDGVWPALTLILFVFGIKAALVPVFFWLPDSYPEAPIPVSALFAGLLTKVGVYAFFRVVPLISVDGPGIVQPVLLIVAAATMLVGVLGALGRSEIRSILSFHVISQVGYMVFGLALYTPLAVAAGIFYIVHHIVVKTALFFAGGMAERMGESGVLGRVRGVAATHPWVAVGFFVPAMALAGLPPFSGFWGKFFLILGGLEAEAWIATGVAILVGLLTLASMLKIWVATFWGPVQGMVVPARGRDPGMLGATLGLAALSVAIGLGAPQVLNLSERAADQLLEVRPYVEAVRGSPSRVVAEADP